MMGSFLIGVGGKVHLSLTTLSGKRILLGTVHAANPLFPNYKIAISVDFRGAYGGALENLTLLVGDAHKLEGEDAGKSRGFATNRHAFLI